MKTKICISLRARTLDELLKLIHEAESLNADIIEIRLDSLLSLKGFERITSETSVPLIATNRRLQEGGFKQQNEEIRIKSLIKAADAGFNYVDVELATEGISEIVTKIRDLGAEPIVSYHDFKRTPTFSDLEKIVEKEKSVGAEICKIVTTANSIDDNVRCLLLNVAFSEETKIVCFAMGEKGALSRILAPIFGAYFTYASLKEGSETAPGQLSISSIKELYHTLGV